MKGQLTLLELNKTIRKGLKSLFPSTIWVQAEISECKQHFSGHCYLELIQKTPSDASICARSKATIWAGQWRKIAPHFEHETGQKLQPGLQVLLEVSVEFHEQYGMNLVVHAIDPAFTLGDQAIKRQQTIRRLEADGVFTQNKTLPEPILPQRIAIISSPQAAGLQDFMHQIANNPYGFVVYTALFSASMQGAQSSASVIQALERIAESNVDFDWVVIIRGGGASIDLTSFDSYELCYYCTQFPVPILAGLGHEKDVSVLDLVAHTSVKTPTAAAAYVLHALMLQSDRMETAMERLSVVSERILSRQTERVTQARMRLTQIGNQRFVQEFNRMERSLSRLDLAAQSSILRTKHRIEMHEQTLKGYDPITLLKRGFSVTLYKGRSVRSVAELPLGAPIKTRLADGEVESIVEKYTNDGK